MILIRKRVQPSSKQTKCNQFHWKYKGVWIKWFYIRGILISKHILDIKTIEQKVAMWFSRKPKQPITVSEEESHEFDFSNKTFQCSRPILGDPCTCVLQTTPKNTETTPTSAIFIERKHLGNCRQSSCCFLIISKNAGFPKSSPCFIIAAACEQQGKKASRKAWSFNIKQQHIRFFASKSQYASEHSMLAFHLGSSTAIVLPSHKRYCTTLVNPLSPSPQCLRWRCRISSRPWRERGPNSADTVANEKSQSFQGKSKEKKKEKKNTMTPNLEKKTM